MPEQFPRVDLASRSDVEHVFAKIERHAKQLVRSELKRSRKDARRGADDQSPLAVFEAAIETWIKAARRRMEPNISINGMPYKEGTGATEPFDQVLSQRVQHMSEQADKLTAEAIKARKTLPAQRAALIRERHAVLQRAAEAREKRRRQDEDDLAEAYRDSADRDEALPTLERGAQVGETLRAAADDIESLSVSLLEQTSAAHEQANFVKRLRIMSASYSS